VASFQTEIPLRAEDFDPKLLEAVERDPEASTYQFVIRAAPFGSAASDVALVDATASKNQEVVRLRAELGAIARSLAATPQAPRLGVILGDPLSPIGKVRIAALLAELTRRLPGFSFTTYALAEAPEVVGATGIATHALLPWTEERAVRLPTEVDAFVIVCSKPGDLEEPLRTIVKDLEGSGPPLHLIAATPAQALADAPLQGGVHQAAPVAVVVDPVALGCRLFAQPLLEGRLDHLRAIGHGPTADRFAVVSLEGLPPAESASVWSAVDAVGRRLDAEVVVVRRAGDSSPSSASSDLEPVDLLALLNGAAVVISDDPGTLALAATLTTPAVAVAAGESASRRALTEWAESYGFRVSGGDGLVPAVELSLATETGPSEVQMITAIEILLDDLAGAVVSSVGPRLTQSVPQRLAELVDEINVLEAANAGLRLVLGRERSAFAARAQVQLRPEQAVDRPDLKRSLHEAQQEIARLRFELDAVYGTRTMRAVQPARRVYAKLRTLRR
jgi:hypothetical protein